MQILTSYALPIIIAMIIDSSRQLHVTLPQRSSIIYGTHQHSKRSLNTEHSTFILDRKEIEQLTIHFVVQMVKCSEFICFQLGEIFGIGLVDAVAHPTNSDMHSSQQSVVGSIIELSENRVHIHWNESKCGIQNFIRSMYRAIEATHRKLVVFCLFFCCWAISLLFVDNDSIVRHTV